ncbi:peptide deformylase [Mastigocoleus sp. MO_188.B34]|uniref:peptide deformylase n=1 Tax=Mastigocoleus sp. MO_188.B34 TaxID=3036635 RepID=UPI00261CF1D1|nr:peptide deformylase [Mastigocoleus sp. MO_188.B34]MDJ0697796.1 peptide deformylase [Mastigocoleus sp. MO_188.B34]
MTSQLNVIELGNPILRQRAEPVKNIKDESIQKLIDELMVTVIQADGVGIAAPQVARSHRLFIMASRPNPRYPKAPYMEPTAIINPKIIGHSSETAKDWEGCLSVPGIRGLVPRYQTIEVEYCDIPKGDARSDRNGKLQKLELTDFVARIFQHEFDHLEGKVFLDRVESTLDLITEAEYQKLMGIGD